MNHVKHTAAPWTLSPRGVIFGGPDQHTIVGSVNQYPTHGAVTLYTLRELEAQADARLMLAAPDMFRLLSLMTLTLDMTADLLDDGEPARLAALNAAAAARVLIFTITGERNV